MIGRILGVVGLAVVALTTQARSADEWLQRMESASARLGYSGEVAYFDGRTLAAVRVDSAEVQGRRRDLLMPLDGPAAILERIGTPFEEGDAAGSAGEAQTPEAKVVPERAGARFRQIEGRYRTRIGETRRIAGRDAVCVDVVPVDRHRHGYRFWIDRETGLLLGQEIRDSRSSPLEMVQFMEIAIASDGSAPAERAQSPGNALVQSLPPSATRPVPGDVGWRVTWVPPGFFLGRPAGLAQTSDESAGGPPGEPAGALASMTFSDGPAAFTLFFEPWPGTPRLSLESARGASVIVDRCIVAADATGYLVTLVGDIPLPTARRIIGSVQSVQ